MTTTFTPRGAAVASFLTLLDALVQKEVNHVDAGGGRWELEAERIAAEAAAALASLRDDLRRHRIALGD